MAKKGGWPQKSMGVFSTSYQNIPAGKAPAERDPGNKEPGGKPKDAKSRMVIPGTPLGVKERMIIKGKK